MNLEKEIKVNGNSKAIMHQMGKQTGKKTMDLNKMFVPAKKMGTMKKVKGK